MKAEIIKYAKENLGFSEEDAIEFIGYFIETLDDHCQRMQAAIDAIDFQEIRNLTHSLIGCAGNIGAAAVVEATREFNAAAKAADIEQAKGAFQKILGIRDQLHNS